MEIGASFVSGAEPFELVQPGEGTLDHPAHLAQSGTVGDAASCDQRLDATSARASNRAPSGTGEQADALEVGGVQTEVFGHGLVEQGVGGVVARGHHAAWTSSSRLRFDMEPPSHPTHICVAQIMCGADPL
ncbi:hypothetical protein GCM10027074_76360 [Streptomyces deserti]